MVAVSVGGDVFVTVFVGEGVAVAWVEKEQDIAMAAIVATIINLLILSSFLHADHAFAAFFGVNLKTYLLAFQIRDEDAGFHGA